MLLKSRNSSKPALKRAISSLVNFFKGLGRQASFSCSGFATKGQVSSASQTPSPSWSVGPASSGHSSLLPVQTSGKSHGPEAERQTKSCANLHVSVQHELGVTPSSHFSPGSRSPSPHAASEVTGNDHNAIVAQIAIHVVLLMNPPALALAALT